MATLGDYARFARPRGAKDKKPRRPKAPTVGPAQALGFGGALGFGYSGVRDDIMQNRINKVSAQVRPGSDLPDIMARGSRMGVRHTIKRGVVGAGLGLAGYGAYRTVQQMRRRRRSSYRRGVT